MAVTDVGLCSRALVRLGVTSISSFTGEGDKGNICGTIYPGFIQGILSTYAWRFTLKKAQLARLATAPVSTWSYAYQLPSDLLVLRGLYANSSLNQPSLKKFTRQGMEILTNETTVYADYQYQPDESLFPAYFQEFLVEALAAELAIPITEDLKLEEVHRVKAWGLPQEQRNGGLYRAAKRIDSMQQPLDGLVVSDYSLLKARE